MKTRIIFGFMMIVAVAGLLYGDHWLESSAWAWTAGLPITVGLVLLAAAGLRELGKLTSAVGVKLLGLSGLLGVCGLASLPWWWPQVAETSPTGAVVFTALSLTTAVVFAEQMIRARTKDAVRRVAVTMLAVVYLGAGSALLLAVRMDFGVPTLLLVLAAVKFTDIGAYFTGSFIGRHKLIPWLSPGKSWEGLAGGIVAGAGIAVLSAAVLGPDTLALPRAAVLGAVLALAGQFADLCESLLKRSAEVKDTGAVVPEFGGVLDILDSPLLAAPVAYALLMLLM
ncbi:MAG: phosphatidate cytidylyltransferase [Phycisphaerae bacterium]